LRDVFCECQPLDAEQPRERSDQPARFAAKEVLVERALRASGP
jgi:hypothetical protein